MFTNMKRFVAFLLALVMAFSLLPTGLISADAAGVPEEITDAAYAEADIVFDQLDAAEEGPDKKNKTTEEKVEAAIKIVVASESYVDDSLVRNGNSFTWWTDDGIQCVYSPRMREISEDLTPESGENEIVNEPVAVKGGSPAGNQVYLIGPYYGHDNSFTNQYKNEAKRVAEAIGDTDGYTLYSGTAATVDKVAEAVANGAVVFFDSHGMTDYENENNEWDCSTYATMSYLCLTSTTGLTSEDYNDGALYYSDGICINGATIANHMKKNSPSGILWMAICLGMATNTMCDPLREMGVEVVYGYSESVTFEGDYRFEKAFWDAMLEGNTVAESIAAMKAKWGNYDWSTQIANDYGSYDGYTSVYEAQQDFSAFPVVVSDEDPHPGKRTTSSYGASTLQTVKSTYTLFTTCDHVWASATCTVAATCTLCGRTNGKPLPHSDGNGDLACDTCGKDMSVIPNSYIKVTETPDDWSGQYLIVWEAGNLAFNGSLSVLEATNNGFSVTIEDDMIILDDADADKYFLIEPMTGYAGSYTIKSASGFYIGNTSEKNKVEYDAYTLYQTDLYFSADDELLIETVDYSVLRFNDTQDQMRFRFYKEATYTDQNPVALYKLADGSSSGSGSGSVTCTHSWNAATCTAPKTCSLCGATEGTAAGHTWQAATCLAPKTCSVCNTTEGSVGTHADANGDNACDTCGTSLGSTVVPQDGKTYVKVTSAPSDWSGQYLLVYEANSLAFDGSLTNLDAARNTIKVTIDDNCITLTEATSESYLTITKVSGGYAIQTASGYYIGNTSDSNKLLSSKTTVYTNTLGINNDGSAKITSSGRAIMRFNVASDQMRFRYYKTGSYAGQQPVALYKLVEHTHDYVGAVTAPTCTEAGYTTYTCACGDSYVADEVAATGHKYQVEIVEPTCELLGSITYTCACGHTIVEGIAAPGHNYEESVTAPTCTADGYTTYTCSACGDSYTGKQVAALGHNYVDGACTNCGAADPSVPTGPAVDVVLNPKRVALGLGGSIEAQFYLNYKAIKNVYTNVYVKIIMDVYDDNGVATKTEYILTDGIVSGSSNLVFIYGVAPCYMGRNMEVQVFATKDGVEYCSEISEYSIKKGIMERLEEAYLTKDSDTQMSNLCTLLVDMLYYGAEAQKTFGQAQYDGLVTEGLDEKYVALKTQTIPEATLTNTAVKNNTVHELHAYNLGLGQAVDMQFTFRLASEDRTGYTVKVTWGDGNERVFTADEFYVKSSKYNRVAVVFNNLGAPEMDVEVSVALYKDGVQVSSTYTSSIEANAKTHLDAGTNVDLVNAMLNYGNSAKRLFGL